MTLRESRGLIISDEDIRRSLTALGVFTDVEKREIHAALRPPRGAQFDRAGELVTDRLAAEPRYGVEAARSFWAALARAAVGHSRSEHAARAITVVTRAMCLEHEPVLFLAAQLSNAHTVDERDTILDDAGWFVPGFVDDVVRPIDVNRSEVDEFADDDHVQLGLHSVPGLTRQTAEVIVEERIQRGPFRDYADFLSRTGLETDPLAEVAALHSAGALDALA